MMRNTSKLTRRIAIGSLWAPLAWLLLFTPTAHCQVEQSRYCSKEEQLNFMEAVVRLTVTSRDGVSQGSAVCIGQDKEGACYLLTCEHVIRGGKEFVFDVFPRKDYPQPTRYHLSRYYLWWNPKLDLALIKVPLFVPRSAHLYSKVPVPKTGDPALSVGCGIGAPPTCQVGKLDGRDDRNDIVFARGAVGGRSGGLLCTKGVVGILARTNDDRTFAVSHEKIVAFVKSCGQDWLIRNP